ncbi:bacterial regulatory s, tetR family protein [Acinetobacter baumannii 1437282]|nr:bacterial regulatory s, tetR family protein [Acinetobacter baumannii 1437282]
MAYLNREQRREMILQAAMQVALNEGFSAMTVRRIATEAQTSTGQVHHHFASSSHLKAEAFIKLMQQLDEIENQVSTANALQRLSLLLGCENIEQIQPYLRLWNEAEVLIDQDEEIKRAYNIAMQDWHLSIVNMINEGQAQGEFHFESNSHDIAWRLIAFVCGLEGIYKLGLNGLNEADFKRHTEAMIQAELFKKLK